MDEPSEVFDPVLKPESPQTTDEDSCDDSEPEMLAKDLKNLTLEPSAKKPSFQPVRNRRRRRRPRPPVNMRLVENKSEKILREVQSAFPKRRVRTLLSVQKDPVARMKRFIRIEKKLRSRNGNRNEESEPFRCLCTFCLYQGWDPAENAKIGQN